MLNYTSLKLLDTGDRLIIYN